VIDDLITLEAASLGERMVRPERFELPTFWFVARRWMILCIFVESKREGRGFRTAHCSATVWLHPDSCEMGLSTKEWCARRDSNSRPLGS
jgi:hypothetical protein